MVLLVFLSLASSAPAQAAASADAKPEAAEPKVQHGHANLHLPHLHLHGPSLRLPTPVGLFAHARNENRRCLDALRSRAAAEAFCKHSLPHEQHHRPAARMRLSVLEPDDELGHALTAGRVVACGPRHNCVGHKYIAPYLDRAIAI